MTGHHWSKFRWALEADYSRLLQALLLHQTLPFITDSTWWMYCYISICKYTPYFVPLPYSLSLLWCRQHPCLPCYPEWQQLFVQIYNFNEKALNTFSPSSVTHQEETYALVGLTFSPGRPRSPTVPGSVRPGGPCINQNQDCQLHS